MATFAVFLALGGVSYAAIKLPKNSVGAKQIKAGAVGASEVKNGALKAGDFGRGQLPKGPEGDRGPAGAEATKLWAQISAGANPTVVNSSGNVTVTRAANLAANVTFPSNVSKCSIQLTRVGGTPARYIRVINRPTGSTVGVWTTNVDGMANATTTQDAFDIAVFC